MWRAPFYIANFISSSFNNIIKWGKSFQVSFLTWGQTNNSSTTDLLYNFNTIPYTNDLLHGFNTIVSKESNESDWGQFVIIDL